MRLRSHSLAILAAVLVFGSAACDDSPVSPGGGNAMAITSITPQFPVASAAPQVLTVRGGNFQTGVSVFLEDPDGTERVLSGAAIQNLQSSTFQLTVALPQPGMHEVRVGVSPAAQSQPFPVVVRSTQTAPVLFSVTPASIVRGSGLQPLRFSGVDFDPGLTMTLTAPDGVVTVLTGPQLAAITATSVDVSLVFTKPGAHTFVVTNPSGESSNPVQVIVL